MTRDEVGKLLEAFVGRRVAAETGQKLTRVWDALQHSGSGLELSIRRGHDLDKLVMINLSFPECEPLRKVMLEEIEKLLATRASYAYTSAGGYLYLVSTACEEGDHEECLGEVQVGTAVGYCVCDCHGD